MPLVHFPTYYFFDGSGATWWREDSPTGPLSVDGASNLAGLSRLDRDFNTITPAGQDALSYELDDFVAQHGEPVTDDGGAAAADGPFVTQ